MRDLLAEEVSTPHEQQQEEREDDRHRPAAREPEAIRERLRGGPHRGREDDAGEGQHEHGRDLPEEERERDQRQHHCDALGELVQRERGSDRHATQTGSAPGGSG